MSSIRCSSCGVRILLPTDEEKCMNCGARIMQQIAAAEQQNMEDYYPQEDIPAVPEEEGESSSSAGAADGSLYLPPPPSHEQDSSAFDFYSDTDKMRVIRIQKYNPSEDHRLVKRQQTASERDGSPYHPGSLAAINPRSMLAEPFDSRGVDPAITIETTLPKGFSRRPPDLVGTISNVQSQVENQLTPDGTISIIKMIRELIWSVPGDSQNMAVRQVYVTTLRITTSDGIKKDARLEGYMRGVSPALGDMVSLWGHKRAGILLIYRGYNHTSEGKIRTTTTSSTLFGVAMIVAVLVFIYIVVYYLHMSL